MAVKTKAQIAAEIASLLADNTTGDISALDLRTVLNDLNDSAIYGGSKVYKALLTQTGTSAPVATVLVNTLSGVPTLLYDGVGNYRVQLTGEFTVGKTFMLIGVPENNIGLIKRSNADDDINNLYLYTLLVDGTTFSNNILNCTILIEVYP